MIRSSNPVLSAKTFSIFGTDTIDSSNTMTLQGTINKTFIMFFLLIGSAIIVWTSFYNAVAQLGNDELAIASASSKVYVWIIAGVISGFILAMITIFKRSWSPITAPLYAIAEGLFIGGISAIFEMMYPNIVIQAVGLTFGVFFMLLFLYKSRIINPTENFKLGVVAATGALALTYILSFVLRMFGIDMPFIHENGTFGIIFSIVAIVVAALNLILDFDFIEKGAQSNAPKYMEWYGAFGLTVTMIWLYIEILRLLSKLRSK